VREVEAVEQDVLRRNGMFAQIGERGFHHRQLGVVDDHAACLAVDDGSGIRRALRQGKPRHGERSAGGTGQQIEVSASHTKSVGSVEHVSSSLSLLALPRTARADHPSMVAACGHESR
jgi:hypothetical protein